MAKIAIYTQAYNREKYLRKCIESVLNQTFTDIAYYIADDCSTDSTRDIIKEYAEKDSRIITIYSDKNDMVATFNTALKMIYDSDCTYLAVLDSDDWYEPEFAKIMIDKAEETNMDLIACGLRCFDENTSESFTYRNYHEDFVIPRSMFAETFFTNWELLYMTYTCKLFRISLLRTEPAVLMNSEIGYFGSDTVFLLNYSMRINGAAYCEKLLYTFTAHENAGTQTFFNRNQFRSNVAYYETMNKFLDSLDDNSVENRLCTMAWFWHLINKTISFNAHADYSLYEKWDLIYEIFTNETAVKTWIYLKNAGSMNVITMREGTDLNFLQADKLTSDLFQRMLVNIDRMYENRELSANRDKATYAAISLLCPNVAEFWDSDNISQIFINKKTEYLIIIENSYLDEEQLGYLPISKKNRLFSDISVFLAVKRGNKPKIISEYYKLFNKQMSKKQTDFIFGNNKLLNTIGFYDEWKKSVMVARPILSNDYETAVKIIPDRLDKCISSDYTLAHVLIQAGLFISAAFDCADYYVFFLKAQLELSLNKKDFESFEKQYAELIDMISNDEGVARLYNKYLKKINRNSKR